VQLNYGNVHTIELMYIEFRQNMFKYTEGMGTYNFHLGRWVRGPKMVCMRYTHVSAIYQFSPKSGKKDFKSVFICKGCNKIPREKQHVFIIQKLKLPFYIR
jgi:hypothetical protein